MWAPARLRVACSRPRRSAPSAGQRSSGYPEIAGRLYTKDPITAQGISNAFRDAELCAKALDATFAGRQSFDDAVAGYQTDRDTHSMPMYEFTAQLAHPRAAAP